MEYTFKKDRILDTKTYTMDVDGYKIEIIFSAGDESVDGTINRHSLNYVCRMHTEHGVFANVGNVSKELIYHYRKIHDVLLLIIEICIDSYDMATAGSKQNREGLLKYMM